MKIFSKFIAMIMALCIFLNTSVTNVFAAETTTEHVYQNVVLQDSETVVYQDEEITIVRCENDEINNNTVKGAKSTSYNSVWLNSSSSGSFSVYTSNNGTIGITLKVESSSNNSWAYMSVQKPNGSYFKNNIYVDPTTGNGEGARYKMYFASSGTYTIHYSAYTNVGMRLMCWLY